MRGNKFKLNPKIISCLFGIKNEGINLSKTTNISYHRMVKIFSREGEYSPLLVNTQGQNKGIQIMLILEP
jgi:hypothetical protein